MFLNILFVMCVGSFLRQPRRGTPGNCQRNSNNEEALPETVNETATTKRHSQKLSLKQQGLSKLSQTIRDQTLSDHQTIREILMIFFKL